MRYSGAQNALGQYNKMSLQVGIESASPHRLIQMLLDGALEKLARAKGCMQRGDIAGKGEQIGWAISIIGGLKASLNKDEGGAIAQNLEDLYDYMERRLTQANLANDPALVDEVTSLIRQIKEAWDAIGDQADPQRKAAPGA